MKSKISLLVACLTVVGIANPINAEITKDASPPQASTRVKDLETILRKSGLCKHYPNVVKILKNNTAEIATYTDRRLSDKDLKILALNLAKLITTNVNNLVKVKVRLYDPASIKYWKDIALSTSQIEAGSKTGPEQEKILSSIKIVNNFGLVDGPNLQSRIDLYKHILKLQHAGIPVQPYVAQFLLIEKAEKEKKNIAAQLTDLNNTLANVDSTITKPVSSNDTDASQTVDALEKALSNAKDNEEAALQAVEEAEREQQTVVLPEAYDLDARARNENEMQALQQKVDDAIAAWHKTRQNSDLASEQLQQAKEHY